MRLQHSQDSAEKALGFVRGVARGEFDANTMLVLAVERCLEIIGEAAGELSENTWAAAPDIPWTRIDGMRNRLAHAYFTIDVNYLWETTSRDLRPLLDRVVTLLDSSTDA